MQQFDLVADTDTLEKTTPHPFVINPFKVEKNPIINKTQISDWNYRFKYHKNINVYTWDAQLF